MAPSQRKTDIQFLLNRTSVEDVDKLPSFQSSPACSVQPQEPPITAAGSASASSLLRSVTPSSAQSSSPSLPSFNFYNNNNAPNSTSTTPTPSSSLRRVLGSSAPYYRNPLWSLGSGGGGGGGGLHMRSPTDQVYSTRRKLADPKTSAMDPELNKRRYLCHFPNCGCRFKQRGGTRSNIHANRASERACATTT